MIEGSINGMVFWSPMDLLGWVAVERSRVFMFLTDSGEGCCTARLILLRCVQQQLLSAEEKRNGSRTYKHLFRMPSVPMVGGYKQASLSARIAGRRDYRLVALLHKTP